MLHAAKTHRSDELSIFCPLVKVDAAKREVWGVVTAEAVDKDGEICDYESTVPYYKAVVDEMSKATDGGNIFPLRAMHGLVAAGKGISIEFRDGEREIYMGFKVVDDNEWKKVEESVYTGFSQGGRYVKKWKDGEYVRYTAKPGEVSLVDMPCLTRAHFDYVKADGTVEIRKFAKAGDIPAKEGDLPKSPTPVSDIKEHICDCDCEQCKQGYCQGCTATDKCEGCISAQTKTVEDELDKTGKTKRVAGEDLPASAFLIVGDKEDTSTWKLPVKFSSEEKTKSHIRNALARFNQMKGVSPEQKAKAKSKLLSLASSHGIETSEKKVAEIQELLKEAINNRAYGQLGKGMYNIGNFANVVDQLGQLWFMLEMEEMAEGDESFATDDVRSCLISLLDALLSYTEEEVEEAKESVRSLV